MVGRYHLTASREDFDAGREWIEVVMVPDTETKRRFDFQWADDSYQTRQVAGTLTLANNAMATMGSDYRLQTRQSDPERAGRQALRARANGGRLHRHCTLDGQSVGPNQLIKTELGTAVASFRRVIELQSEKSYWRMSHAESWRNIASHRPRSGFSVQWLESSSRVSVLIISARKLLEALAREEYRKPRALQLGAKRTIEVDGRGVPVEHLPTHAVARLLVRYRRHVLHKRLADSLPAELVPNEDVFNEQAVAAYPRRIGKEVDRIGCGMALPLSNQCMNARVCPQCIAHEVVGRNHNVFQLTLKLGKLTNHHHKQLCVCPSSLTYH